MTTVFHAGGEDVSFTNVGGGAVNAGAGLFRAAFARCGITANSTGTAIPPAGAYWQSPTFTAQSSFWFHAQVSNNGQAGTTNGNPMVGFADAGGVWRLLIEGTGSSGQVKLVKRDAAGTQTTLATSGVGALPAVTAAPTAIDLFVNYAVSGQATLYVNGVIVADTGPGVDVTTNSATAIGPFFISNLGSTFNPGTIWSEVIFQDTDTRGCALQTLPPVAAGNTQSWTPNTVGNINPTTINDANFISTASVNALSQWTLSTTLPTGSWTIEAIVQAARVNAGATGPQHYEFLTRTVDGSDHVQGSVTPPIGSFGNATSIWGTNPHTSAAWASGDLINAGIESLT